MIRKSLPDFSKDVVGNEKKIVYFVQNTANHDSATLKLLLHQSAVSISKSTVHMTVNYLYTLQEGLW